MSSIESAPATIPATRAPTFTSAFEPALPGTLTVSVTSSSVGRATDVLADGDLDKADFNLVQFYLSTAARFGLYGRRRPTIPTTVNMNVGTATT